MKRITEEKKDTIINGERVSYQICRKKMRTLIFKWREGVVLVSAPFRVSENYILSSMANLWPKINRQNTGLKEMPSTDEYIYLFGTKYPRGQIDSDLYTDAHLKNILMSYLNRRVPVLEKEFGLMFTSAITVRKMKTRLGTNMLSKRNLTFALHLVHYHESIIDAIICHELAHYLVPNHSAEYYKVLLARCPDYRELHRKIKKGLYI